MALGGAAGRAWRMGRACAHLGAHRVDGQLKDRCLQCPLHRWRYDEQAQCVGIPGRSLAVRRLEPVPRAARQPTRVTAERSRYGSVPYVSPQPVHPLHAPAPADVQPALLTPRHFALETLTPTFATLRPALHHTNATRLHDIPTTE
ncbi:Rieske 2Fe-2S domain-containing protein, partial [Burkholderia pseudomallei]|uniref:Rieske 2Fe-2S domain-containing protein n=1 Tax=Burkholderia pseudomallei TaxID=28450 RepID=UPI003F6894B6